MLDHSPSRSLRFAVGALALGMTTATLSAQEAEYEAPAEEAMMDAEPVIGDNIWGEFSLDFTSSYFFFGIPQENQGLIFQNTFILGLTLPEFDLGGESITTDVYAGTFNSLHFDNPSNDEATQEGLAWWYEGDVFVGAVLGLPAGFTLDVSYWSVNGPSIAEQFDQEFDIFVFYDDAPLWEMADLEGFALAPYAAFIIETDGGADGLGSAGEPGKLFLAGVEPSFTIIESEDYPVTLSIPLEFGIDIDDYYENTAGEDDSFGYFQAGASLSTPLSFIPQEYGAWEGHVTGNVIFLGDATQEIGQNDFDRIGDDDTHAWVSTGVSLSF